MARFDGSNIDHYGSQSNGSGVSFFQLKNDKDCARARFLYNGAEDIEGFTVHRVQIGDKERDVNCLREYNDPIDKCPLCSSKKYPTSAKLYIPVYNEDMQQIQLWSRGKSFYSKISGWCARYPNTVSRVVDIERNGAKGDTKTDYQFYPVSEDDTTIDDILDECGLEELPNPLGTIILDKTAEEMETFLQTGSFDTDGVVPSRRGRSQKESATEEEPPFDGGARRRSSGRGRGDRF